MKQKNKTIVFPVGLIAKVRKANNGFRTKREVAEMFAGYGLTYEMLFDINEGYAVAPIEQTGVKKCRYAMINHKTGKLSAAI